MKGSGHQITKEEYLRIGRILRARFRRAGVSLDDIDDLVQETFLHAQKGLDRGRYKQRSAIDTWVVGIGKKRLLKHRDRSRTAKRKGPEVALDDPNESAARGQLLGEAGEADDRLIVRQIVNSLHRLPGKLREPLVLITNGHSYREAAVVLGLTTDLVTSRVHQARSKLRELHSRPRPPTS